MTADDVRVGKRPCVGPAEAQGSSKFFAHFRAVGRVADHVPAAIHYMGGMPYITTSVGKSFQIFDVESLNVIFASPDVGAPILALASKGEETIVATADSICIFDRARLVDSAPLEDSGVGSFRAMSMMGDTLAVLGGQGVELWTLAAPLEARKRIPFACDSSATCFVHPPTYLNKLVVGFADGHMELWNVHSGKLVFSFGELGAPISFLAAAPVVDIVAVGLASGTVIMMDVRQNKQLFSLQHQAAVNGISFRTDINEESQMAVSLANGTVVLWDLDKRRLVTSWIAHEGYAVASLSFIQGQPVLVTTSAENAIKEWIVEGSEVRPLRCRSGHSKAPRRIRFYGDEGEAILSAGRDKAFRVTSMIKDSQSAELSQGSIQSIANRAKLSADELKLDPIVSFDSFITKDLKWDNVVTAHEKSFVARTWRADHKKLGSHELKAADKSFITAVAMSACGNFALLGTAKGSVDVFNVQSGLHRKHFAGPESPVVGLGIDAVNQYVLCAHRNGEIRSIGMVNGQVRLFMQVEGEILATAFHADSEMLAAVLSNNEVQLFDAATGQLVRRFAGHADAVVDVQFSHGGHWLISASADRTVRTWDLATGLQIDLLKVSAKPVSVAISPSLDFLAVVLEDDVAIHLYSNISMYRPVAFDHVQKGHSELALDSQESSIVAELVELSLEPRSKWSILYNLETIKARNKPVLPLKSSIEKAPFFLDALLASSDRKRTAAGDEQQAEGEPAAEAAAPGPIDSSSRLHEMLRHGTDNPEDIFTELKTMGPSSVDFEIRSLSAHCAEELTLLLRLLEVLVGRLDSNRDYELAVTYLNLILKAHADLIQDYPAEFANALAKARTSSRAAWDTLQGRFQSALCLTSFSRDQY